MKSQIIKQDLLDLLELINEQSDLIQKQVDKTPQLYIDMLKENVLKFYENLHKLDKSENSLAQSNLSSSPKVKDEIKKKKTVQPKPILEKEEKISKEPEPISIETQDEIPEQAEVKEPSLRLKPESNITTAVEEPKEENIQVEQPIAIKKEVEDISKGPVFSFKSPEPNKSLFKDAAPTIGDKLKAHQDPSLADTIQQEKIKDIKEEIGINDKFLLINELFDGNMKAYNELIEQLNTKSSYNEAIGTLEKYSSEKKWNNENEALLKLKNFVERRYK